MEFDEIYEAVSNGEMEMGTDELTNLVVAALTKDGIINCDTLQEVITGLQGVKKTAKKEYEDFKKQIADASKEELATRSKAYVETLQQGERITWMKSDGQIATGTLGEQKKGSKTVHVLLDEIPANSTAKNPKPDRYVKYHAIIVPEGFEMPAKAEVVA